MRLIDADRVVATLTAENTRDDDTLGYADGLLDGIEVYAEALRNAPTIDAVPVVRCGKCACCHEEMPNALWCQGRGFPYQLVPQDGYCDRGRRREDA